LATIIKQILWQQAKTGINGVLEKQLMSGSSQPAVKYLYSLT